MMKHLLLLSILNIFLSFIAANTPLDNAKELIQNHIKKYYSPLTDSALCVGNKCCNITSSSSSSNSAPSCAINTFPKDESTLVLPGGETRCIFSYSTPFAFQVSPPAFSTPLYPSLLMCWLC